MQNSGKFQMFISNKMEPFSQKISQNKVIKAITASMMGMMPLMLAGAVFSLISNFPITQVPEFLTNIGVKPVLDSFVSTQTNLTPVFLSFLVGFNYAKSKDVNPLAAGMFSLLTYFILIPENITIGETTMVGYTSDYLGSNGIFISLIIGILISALYAFLTKKNIVLRLPDTVPPMVSQSFEPVFSGIIVIGCVLLVKGLLGLTPLENIFNVIAVFLQGPIMKLGANVPALILLYTMSNFLWYFGIHPSTIVNLYSPVLMTIFTENVTASLSGQEIPYYAEGIVQLVSGLVGSGSTIGLAIAILLFAKSKRYKAMGKLAAVPSLFNITEPLMFGFPVILNPLFFFHMILSPGIILGLTWGVAKLGWINFNPVAAASTPWTMPLPITGFLAGGFPFMILILVIIAFNTLAYIPFLKALDKQAIAEEEEELQLRDQTESTEIKAATK